MASYTVKFNGTRTDKEKQALNACIEYMGRARYLAFRRQVVDFVIASDSLRRAMVYRWIRMACWGVGITGYWPSRAVARHVFSAVKMVKESKTQVR